MRKVDLSGKVAIVTGASSGIGQATALALARQGACVALGSRKVSALNQLAMEIEHLGREALVVPTDVTRQEQVEALIGETLSRWGQVDILVSNAGQYIRSPIAQLAVPVMEQSMAVNFYAGVYSVLAVLPHMLSRKQGHIVLVSTMNARKALPPDAPYVAAKFALTGFGEVLRQELYATGVSVTLVYPGRVDTPLIESLRVPSVQPKIPAALVAQAIVTGIRRRQTEIFVPSRVRWFYYLNVLSPRLADAFARYFHLEGRETQDTGWGYKQ